MNTRLFLTPLIICQTRVAYNSIRLLFTEIQYQYMYTLIYEDEKMKRRIQGRRAIHTPFEIFFCVCFWKFCLHNTHKLSLKPTYNANNIYFTLKKKIRACETSNKHSQTPRILTPLPSLLLVGSEIPGSATGIRMWISHFWHLLVRLRNISQISGHDVHQSWLKKEHQTMTFI